MRTASLRGVCRRKWITTTVRRPDARPAPDLVERAFVARGPPTGCGSPTSPTSRPGPDFCTLAIVLDAFSCRVVGWAMASHLRTDLVLAALDTALGQRRPGDVVHHSDQGTQYTSVAFGMRCQGHSGLGYHSPLEFERRYHQHNAVTQAGNRPRNRDNFRRSSKRVGLRRGGVQGEGTVAEIGRLRLLLGGAGVY